MGCEMFANMLLLDLTPEKYTGGSGKGGPEPRHVLQKHRLDFKQGGLSQKLSIPIHLQQLSPFQAGQS